MVNVEEMHDGGGKDWNKLPSFIVFTYLEVPQATTGFSPFELLYGKAVRGSLNISKET